MTYEVQLLKAEWETDAPAPFMIEADDLLSTSYCLDLISYPKGYGEGGYDEGQYGGNDATTVASFPCDQVRYIKPAPVSAAP